MTRNLSVEPFIWIPLKETVSRLSRSISMIEVDSAAAIRCSETLEHEIRTDSGWMAGGGDSRGRFGSARTASTPRAPVYSAFVDPGTAGGLAFQFQVSAPARRDRSARPNRHSRHPLRWLLFPLPGAKG